LNSDKFPAGLHWAFADDSDRRTPIKIRGIVAMRRSLGRMQRSG
jgi:hypothetical protein